MDQVKELLKKVSGNMETFKGMRNIYTIIAKADNGAKLGVLMTPAREYQPTGGGKGVAITGIKLRFALIGGEGMSINVAPFTVRMSQDFSLADGTVVPGFLLDAQFIGLTQFEMSPFEFLAVCTKYQIKEKTEALIAEAIGKSEFKLGETSIATLFDLMTQAFPTEEDRQDPSMPVFNGKENVVTFITEKEAKKSKKKPKKYDDEDIDDDDE